MKTFLTGEQRARLSYEADTHVPLSTDSDNELDSTIKQFMDTTAELIANMEDIEQWDILAVYATVHRRIPSFD